MLNTHLTRPVNNTVLIVFPQVKAMIESRAKDNGRKRHIAVDTIGLLLPVLVTAAGVQDRDGARPLLWNLRRAFPSVKLAWADGGYAGKLVTCARTKLRPRLTLQIVKRPGDLHTFQVLPRRWVVERTLAWITRCRRTVRDYERLTAHHETVVYWAMIHHHEPAPRPAATSLPAAGRSHVILGAP